MTTPRNRAKPTRTARTRAAFAKVGATLAATLLALAAPAARSQPAVPACDPDHLALRFDAVDGDPAGMAQNGAVLLVQNTGRTRCEIPSLPQLDLQDASHAPLPAARRPPPGLHPGPVLLPVALAPGQTARSVLHWLPSAGDPARSRCVVARYATLTLPGGLIGPAELAAQLCAPAGAFTAFEQPPLQP